MPAGIVGATIYGSDGRLDGAWTAPRGRRHTFTQDFPPGSAGCADLGNWFSGAGGTWSWSATFRMTYPGTPLLAAYAPLGRLAAMFPSQPPFTNGSPCDA